jgi:transcriptional regulator with XRE-family HTH domain
MGLSLPEGFGRNLWRHRRRVGLSQEELGARSELHRNEISKIELGRQIPRIDTILKLSAGLEVSPCELLAGLRWHPGYFVEGEFQVEDGSEWAAQTEHRAGVRSQLISGTAP